MTDQILSEDQIAGLEETIEAVSLSYSESLELFASHRLLSAKLEKKKAALKDRGVIEAVLEICEEERDALKERVKELENVVGNLRDRLDVHECF